jgi:Ca-activated chloride channel family protein
MVMNLARLPVVCLAVTLVGAGSLGARQRAQQPFRSGIETVPVYATVIDAAGRLVPDLEQKDFDVFDNDKRQDITLFKSDTQPITVVVMLDTSGSMTMNLERLKDAAESFVLRLLPDDKARIGNFDDKIIISPAFTHDRDELVRFLHEDIQYGNGTRLWDAVDTAMTALSHEQGRRVVLVFTDGDDTTSKRSSLDSVLKRAQLEDFMIYAIGFRSQFLGTTTRPDKGLRKLAEETGGGYFELSKALDLNSTFTRVADELHRQYVIGFSPATLDGKVHKLDLRILRPGMTARSRKTYVAAAGAKG